MLNFDTNTTTVSNIELIPAGTLCKGVIVCEEAKLTKPNPEKGTAGGGRYLSCKITIAEGPFLKRSIYTMLMDPEDMHHSEAARTMGLGQLVRMLEATGVFDPANPASYRAMTFDQAWQAIVMRQSQGATVAIEVGIQKGTGGYSDKNVVRNYLSPNPKSDSFKKWQTLQAGGGVGGIPPVQGAFAGFGGAPMSSPTAAAPGFFRGPEGQALMAAAPTMATPPATTVTATPLGSGTPAGWLAAGNPAGAQVRLGASGPLGDDDIPF